MIAGIGLDLCEIERMKRAIQRPHFVDRVFTAAEAGRIRGVPPARAAEIAAGLFAAKEAVSKALGTGIAGFGPADIEITPDGAGRPVCTLHEGALDRAHSLCGAGECRVWVSITHEKGMAAATAIIEK
jgi:holo-[acyl-carrier protein] synthase